MSIPPRARRRAGAGAVALLAAGCAGAPRPPADPSAGPAVAVSVAAAESVAWTDDLEVSATVHALRRALPGTVLMGRVEQVLRREGDAVQSGAVLARVEAREVRSRLAQAEAGVAAARALEHNARLMRERLERLHARQAAAQKSVDDAIAAHAAAAAQREAAEQAVAAARMYVSYADVVAPFAGVVVERRIEPGDTAAPGMPLFAIEDLSRVKVEAEVAETAALALAPGQPVRVELSADAATPRDATIAEILPTADAQSRTFTVRVLLDNPDGALRSGMFARLRLPGAARAAVTLPARAVVRRGPLTGVHVVGADGVARLRWIALGAERDGRAAVLAGLAAGERVVLDPPADFADGTRVEAR